MTDKKHEPPSLEPTVGDAAHSVGRALASLFPGGGAVAELLGAVLAPPLIRRQQAWREEIADVIHTLKEKHGIDPEQLSDNENFIDAVLRASDAAVRTRQEEKLKALRAAIENSALNDAPDEALQQVFFNLIDDLTVWHLRILTLFHDPPGWFKRQGREIRERITMSSLGDVLEEAFPELRGRRGFYDLVWRDLHSSGLVNNERLQTMTSPSGAAGRNTSDLGQAFLRFITTREM